MVRIWQPDWRDRLAQIRVDATEAQSTQFRFVPFAPTMFEATPLTGTSVKLSWVPGDDGGSDITGYQVRYRVSGGAWGLWTDLVGADKDTDTVDVTGLKVSTLYSFQIRAENGNGVGAASTTDDVTTTGPPGKPSGLTVTSVPFGPNELQVAWTASGSDGGSPITSWQYQIGSADPVTVTGGGSVTSVRVPNLEPATKYTIRVRAVNANGNSPWSDTVDGTTDAGLPTAPTGVQVTARTSVQITVVWAAAVVPDGYPITAYEVSTDGATWTEIDAETFTATITGLSAGTKYTIRVRAVNANGNSTAATVSATTQSTPGPVTGLTVTNTLLNSVAFTWSPPTAGATVIRYEYRVKKGADGTYGGWVSVALTRIAAATGLDEGTLYTIEVRAVAVGGDGEGTEVTGTTKQRPGRVQSLAATAGRGSLAVEWSAPASGATVVRYEYRIKKGTGDFGSWISTSRDTRVTVSSLDAETTYTVEVRAVSADYNGFAESVSKKTLAAASAVQDLSATVTHNSVRLSWDPPSSGAEVTGYWYRYKPRSAQVWTVWRNAGRSIVFTVVGLLRDTLYDFVVRPRTAQGNGEIASLSARTSDVPNVPGLFDTSETGVTEKSVSANEKVYQLLAGTYLVTKTATIRVVAAAKSGSGAAAGTGNAAGGGGGGGGGELEQAEWDVTPGDQIVVTIDGTETVATLDRVSVTAAAGKNGNVGGDGTTRTTGGAGGDGGASGDGTAGDSGTAGTRYRPSSSTGYSERYCAAYALPRPENYNPRTGLACLRWATRYISTGYSPARNAAGGRGGDGAGAGWQPVAGLGPYGAGGSGGAAGSAGTGGGSAGAVLIRWNPNGDAPSWRLPS